MINMVYGGLYGLMLVIAFIIGYRNGRKVGLKEAVDACADKTAEIITTYCCEDCVKRIKSDDFLK